MTKKLLATTSLLAAGFLSQDLYAVNGGDDKEQTTAIAAKAPGAIPAAAPAEAPVEASFFGRLFSFGPKLPPVVTPADLKAPVAATAEVLEAAPAAVLEAVVEVAPAAVPAPVDVQADAQRVEAIQQNLAEAVHQLEADAAKIQQSPEIVLTADQAQAMDLARSLTLDTVKQIEEAKSPEEQQQIIQQAVLSASKMPGIPVAAPTAEQWTWFGMIAKIVTLGLYSGSSAAPVAAPAEAPAPVADAAPAPVAEAPAPVVDAAAPVADAAPVGDIAALPAPVLDTPVEVAVEAPAVDTDMAETTVLTPLDRVFRDEDIQKSLAQLNRLLDEDLQKSVVFETPQGNKRTNRKQTLVTLKKQELRSLVNEAVNKKLPLANWDNGEVFRHYVYNMMEGAQKKQGFGQLSRLLAAGTPISLWHTPARDFLLNYVLPKDQAKKLEEALKADAAQKLAAAAPAEKVVANE